ncbi:hypothetical protein LPLAFNJD_LOCUS1772 [Methylorubrum aminovorans]
MVAAKFQHALLAYPALILSLSLVQAQHRGDFTATDISKGEITCRPGTSCDASPLTVGDASLSSVIKRQSNKIVITPDTLEILGPGSTGDISATSRVLPGVSGAVPRPIGEAARDHLNVKEFGAKLDGVSDDTQAFSKARTAAARNATIDVPAGGFLINSAPNGGPNSPVLWRMNGNTYGTGNSPVTNIGTDTVETFLDGAKYFGKVGNSLNQPAVVRIDSQWNYWGTTSQDDQGTVAGLEVNGTIPAVRAPNFIWLNRSVLYSSAHGTGQHVALTGSTFRPANALADGNGPRSPIWGAYAEGSDLTNRPSNEAGIVHGMEINLGSGNTDTAKNRVALLISAGLVPGATFSQVGTGISIGGASEVEFGTFFRPRGKFYEAALSFLDVEPQDKGSGPPPIIQMRQNQTIAFDETNALTLREVTGLMQWRNGQQEIYRLDGRANTDQLGTATARAGLKGPSVTSVNAGTGVLIGAFVRTAEPTTADIPAGQCADWNNTAANTMKRVCNVAGALRSITYN